MSEESGLPLESLLDLELERYAARHTTREPELLARLERETHSKMANPQMLTGRLQGQLLRLLVQLLEARRVLEIGTFTGYSALMMASGLPDGGTLVTCEIDPDAERVARRYFDESPHGKKIDLRMGPALETISGLDPFFDFVFIDADKSNYPEYYRATFPLVRVGGLIAVDNVLWSGRVLDPEDADSRAIVELNRVVQEDPRVDNVLTTIRDGLLLVRKREES